MKRYLSLILFLLFLSCVSGYLMSKPSLIGRIGIELFYKEYQFLRIWWQGALVVFSLLSLVLLLQHVIVGITDRRKALLFHLFFLLLAATGFYFTWQDFHHTRTHRWLRERFHIGAYLFWLGWAVVSVYFLIRNRKAQ